jgi:hypothetical protein
MMQLTKEEKKFVELIVEVGGQPLDQDVFEFMMDEGVAVDLFRSPVYEFSIDEVTSSLREKGLVKTETIKETIRDPGDISSGPINFNDVEFRTVEREYIYFTEKMATVYDEEGPHG